MTAVRRHFARAVAGLSRDLWLLQLGALLNAFGTGLAAPFVLIYLHNVRGFALSTAGVVLVVESVAGLFAVLGVGPAVDRFGPRRVLAAALVLSALGFGGYAIVREPWHGLMFALLTGAGIGAFLPAQASLIAQLADAGRRSVAYATQRVTQNLGIGLGGAVGGLVATTQRPVTYLVLLLGNAATFLAYAFLLPLLRETVASAAQPTVRIGGYRDVVRDRRFLSFVIIHAVLVSVGLALLMDILPAYAKNEAGVTERAIGLVFLINTLVVVVAQIPVARALAGRRRLVAYAFEAALIAVAWLTVAVAGTRLDGDQAALVIAVAVAVFALGECFHGSVVGPLVADFAKPRLIGRYVALHALVHQLTWAGGRGAGALALAFAPNGLWVMAAALAAVAGGAALVLDRALPADVRRAPGRRGDVEKASPSPRLAAKEPN